MKKKLITIIIGMVFCIGWIGGCASKEINHDNVATSVIEESKQEGVKKEKLPTATYMGGNNTITEICKELSSAGASHVDTFQEWVTDFADSAGKNAKLKDSWSDPEKMHTDTGKCMDGWEKNHDYSDTYQATKVHNMDELLNILSLRPEYFGEEGEAGPFVYNNGEYVGTLTNKNN